MQYLKCFLSVGILIIGQNVLAQNTSVDNSLLGVSNLNLNISNNNTDVVNKNISYPNNWIEVSEIYKKEVETSEVSTDEKNKVAHLVGQRVNEKILENDTFNRSQFFVIVDRNPKTQNTYLGFYDSIAKTISISDPTKTSTGSTARKHFITPLGWFENIPDNGSYRALGTKNEYGIRGIGKKGMRVFDFGWNKADAGWRDNFQIDIRLQIHATDPDFLEKKLGTPDSKGCVRVKSDMNVFLDKYGILDYNFENSEKMKWVLRKDRQPIKNAGSFMLVIDTNDNPKGI